MRVISENIRVRVPEHFDIGDSIVDDWCYFSTRLVVGRGSHIASGCSIAGGAKFLCQIGDYTSLSSGVRVWCSSNDFVNDLIAITDDIPTHAISGDVTIGDYCGIGANSVVMPANNIPEGVAIGALSFVPPGFVFEPWMVYAGIPIRPLKKRNRPEVLRQVALL